MKRIPQPALDALLSFAVEADAHYRARHRGRVSKRCEACQLWSALTPVQARSIRNLLEQSIANGQHRYCVLCSNPRERRRRMRETARWLQTQNRRKAK